MRVVLGVGGGIAAYKAVLLLRMLTTHGHDVTVIPTEGALRFVGAATFEALSGKRVSTTVWDEAWRTPHVELGREAELVIVAPATADLLSRAASGRADDLLSATLLMVRCPVVYAPAMHSEMWEHPATKESVKVLRSRGSVVLPVGRGMLAHGDEGEGRMAEVEDILALAELAGEEEVAWDLVGRRILVSAGGTREALDPVRFLGNHSSGKQGYAVARVAAARGAEVVLVSTSEKEAPFGVEVEYVESAEEMHEVVLRRSGEVDAVVMAAAVADWMPEEVGVVKAKKGGFFRKGLELVRTPDILAEVAQGKPHGQVVVGFAAETGDGEKSVLEYAREKMAVKGCDLLVANDVSKGVFGEEESAATILSRGGEGGESTVSGSKEKVASRLLTRVREIWGLVEEPEGE